MHRRSPYCLLAMSPGMRATECAGRESALASPLAQGALGSQHAAVDCVVRLTVRESPRGGKDLPRRGQGTLRGAAWQLARPRVAAVAGHLQAPLPHFMWLEGALALICEKYSLPE